MPAQWRTTHADRCRITGFAAAATRVSALSTDQGYVKRVDGRCRRDVADHAWNVEASPT
jgi:hypothetical protein